MLSYLSKAASVRYEVGKSWYERYSQGKTVFYSIQYKNGCLASSDPFHMFTQLIKFQYIPLSRIKEYRCLKNVIHQIDSKN